MRLRPTAVLLLMSLAACGGGSWKNSSMNPSNWFGGRQPDAVVPVATALPADPRPFVDRVLTMSIDTFPGGAIVRATGLPPTQGYWNAELVALPLDEKGLQVLEFHIVAPTDPAAVINQQSREVTVAYDFTARQLAEISRIEVRAAKNSLSKSP